MARSKKIRDEEEQPYEQLETQTGLGVMRDFGDGSVYAGIAGVAGLLQVTRTPEGSLSVSFVFEEKELWYANVVVFAAADKVMLETKELIGPHMTQMQAIQKAGEWAGEIMLKYLVDDDADTKR